MPSYQATFIGSGVSLKTPTADGSANQALITDGAGNLSFGTPAAPSSDTHVIYNDGGVLAGDANFIWDKTNGSLTVKSALVGAVPLNVDTVAGQTSDLAQFKKDGVNRFRFKQSGHITLIDDGQLENATGNYVRLTATDILINAPLNVNNAFTLPLTDGTASQVLQTDGLGTVTWETVAGGGGGDVTKVGTPVDNQVGVWTGDGTIEGDANFTWSGSLLTVTDSAGLPQVVVQSGTRAFDYLAGLSNSNLDYSEEGEFRIARKPFADRGTNTNRTTVLTLTTQAWGDFLKVDNISIGGTFYTGGGSGGLIIGSKGFLGIDSGSNFDIEAMGTANLDFYVGATTSAVGTRVGRFDDATGYFGLNQDVPTAQLHVNPSSTSTVGLLVAGPTSHSVNLAEFTPDGGTATVIDEDGQVGIGIDSPTSLLHIYNGTTASTLVLDIETSQGATAGLRITTSTYDTTFEGSRLHFKSKSGDDCNIDMNGGVIDLNTQSSGGTIRTTNASLFVGENFGFRYDDPNSTAHDFECMVNSAYFLGGFNRGIDLQVLDNRAGSVDADRVRPLLRLSPSNEVWVGDAALDENYVFSVNQHSEGPAWLGTTLGDATVTGLNTYFTYDLNPGSQITINGNSYTVDSITSDSELELTTTAVATESNEQYTIDSNPFRFGIYKNGGVVVQGAVGQPRALQSWKNSGGTELAAIGSTGGLTVSPSDTTTVGLIVNNPTSTTANVAEFQINSVSQWVINASGEFAAPDVVTGASARVIHAADTSGAEAGADLRIRGGTATGTNQSGGHLFLSGGNKNGTGTEGNVYLGQRQTSDVIRGGVAMGVSAPSAVLHIDATSATGGLDNVIRIDNTGLGVGLLANRTDGGACGLIGTGASSNFAFNNESGNYFSIGSIDRATLVTGSLSGFTRHLYVLSTGEIGINEATPAVNLHITDSLPIIRLEDSSGSDYAEISSPDGHLKLNADVGGTEASSEIRFFVDNVKVAYIDENGALGLNQATVGAQLDVQAVNTTTVGLIVNNPTSTTANVADFQINGTSQFKIDSGGVPDLIDQAASSSDDPTTDAPTDWMEVKMGGTSRMIPLYTKA